MIALPTTIPLCRENAEFVRLPAQGSLRFRWRKEMRINIHGLTQDPVELRDADGRVWGRISPNHITISKGYAWNGCSPKRAIAGLWFGTPDPECTILASGIHDILFQFSGTYGFPLTFDHCNEIFERLIFLSGGVITSVVYGGAVKAFGKPFWGHGWKTGLRCVPL